MRCSTTCRSMRKRSYSGLCWRPALEATLAGAVAAVLEHTRPQQVHVTLAVESGALVATLWEGGQWWQGEPSPEDVLDELRAARPLAFEDVRHQSDGTGNTWVLRRGLARYRATGPKARPRSTGAELSELVAAAAQLAREPKAVQLPHLERGDELGELARALGVVQDLLVEREVLMERLPIGISWLTADLRWRAVNQAFLAQHGRTREEVIGRSMLEQVDPAVLSRGRHHFVAASDTAMDVLKWQNRYIKEDGAIQWLAITSIPLRDRDGTTTGWLAFSEDETRRLELEKQAIDLQQLLFPAAPPALVGYDLTGRCMPADLMMSGDFYDWEVLDHGRLDLTVADVMGKGPAAALLMTAMRSSLRAVSSDLEPAARLDRAARPLAAIAAAGGRFVTLFHARVDLASGRFAYVDAGHGHWAIRRTGGELVRPGGRSLPVFVAPDEPFAEAEARLAPGDSLIVYSDGLVEAADRTLSLEECMADLQGEADAETTVKSLLGRLPAFLPDDATVVALRRLG